MTSATTGLEIVREPGAMRARVEVLRATGRRIAVVPTMGYLHEGHLSLIRAARDRADVVILTLFVNPTQFAPNEDLSVYPRDEAGDVAKAQAAGADLVFAPEPAAMYPTGHQTTVDVGELTGPLDGASRPGHFRGVTTVVTKLFNITRPHIAFFGLKDFQQLAVIRRMTLDLDFGIEIVGMPIVREADGLALSSRNAYLSAEEHAQALVLSRGLLAAQALFEGGERNAARLTEAAKAVIAQSPLARIDYVELRDADSLTVIDAIERPSVMAMAVFVGRTRLLDNRVFEP